jgi:hypothetical protein
MPQVETKGDSQATVSNCHCWLGTALLLAVWLSPARYVLLLVRSGPSSSNRYTVAMLRFLRYLRIASSVFCGLACVLFVGLWMRSYFWVDTCNIASRIGLTSCYGTIAYQILRPLYSFQRDWYYECEPVADYVEPHVASRRSEAMQNLLRFSWKSRQMSHVPHWAFTMLFVGFSIAPWIHKLRWRFSLRTLLIATTIIAGALGLIIAFSR